MTYGRIQVTFFLKTEILKKIGHYSGWATGGHGHSTAEQKEMSEKNKAPKLTTLASCTNQSLSVPRFPQT